MVQGGEVFKVCAGSGSCETYVQRGLVQLKRRDVMIIDERCVTCESGAGVWSIY